MVDAAVNFDKFEADKNSTWPGASIPNKAQSNPGGRHQQQQMLNRMFLDHLVLQRYAFQYACRIAVQQGHQEEISDFKVHFKELLKEFYKRTNQKKP
ncbi:hypothetical protein BSKO_13977 [Bryopsis sp. KO-2023]|nr:hypothetical protein BSKO_13977 [Bryopsis sp. KO-2023]